MATYVLIVEVDNELRHSIAELLQGEGMEVVEETESSEVVTRVMQRDPAIIIMAEDILSIDGVDLLTLLRRLTISPIMVIGAGDATAEVRAFLEGADIYLRKPVNYRELLSRMRVLLHRAEPESSDDSP